MPGVLYFVCIYHLLRRNIETVLITHMLVFILTKYILQYSLNNRQYT